jgi:hypothetical protein
VHRSQLPGLAERCQRLEEGALLIVGGEPGPALLALVAGQAPVGLDVEEEVIRGASHPVRHAVRGRDPVKAGVDLNQREVPGVEGETLALPPATELVRVELLVVDPVAGTHQDRGPPPPLLHLLQQ